MTDEEVFNELRSESVLNTARQLFSTWSAKIEQAQQQRSALPIIELRRMEFKAVQEIARVMMSEGKSPLDTIMDILLVTPENERSDLLADIRYNEIFCWHCGRGSRERPAGNCQCWNNE